MRRMVSLIVFMICCFSAPFLVAEDDIVVHPNHLSFSPLEYDPQHANVHRHTLKNGVVGFFVEDHDLPLINVRLVLKIGSYLDPLDKLGLIDCVVSLLRSGGTARWTAEAFDEEADFLAANILTSASLTSSNVTLNVQTKDLDRGLDLLFEMLKNPAFEKNRLNLYKSRVLQNLQRRNDRTDSIERREWVRLLRGEHPSSAQVTRATIESLSVEDLITTHRSYFHPGNFIFAISGDFDTDEIKLELEQRMENWEIGVATQPISPPNYRPFPGIYMVNKPDVNQGRVSIGHLGIKHGNPDEFAIDLMNDILGGSGFTSRLMNRVRSDEGLAYSAASSFSAGAYYQGTFRAAFQSKSRTCAQAIQIVLDEIERMRSEKVSPSELETVRNNAVEVFPRFFASARIVARTFAMDQLIGRESDYWLTYRDRLKEVTVEDIFRVAKKYLQPDQLVILVIGNVEEILKGNPDKPEYSLEKLFSTTEIRKIPLPDPETMIYSEK